MTRCGDFSVRVIAALLLLVPGSALAGDDVPGEPPPLAAPVPTIRGEPVSWLAGGGLTRERWLQMVPTLELEGDADFHRPAEIRFVTFRDGLALHGLVRGGEPRFEGTAETLTQGDHVEIWFTLAPRIELPAIGWGSQSEEILVEDEGHCSRLAPRGVFSAAAAEYRCRSWVRGQAPHRERFTRLFSRRWKLAAPARIYRSIAVEDWASRAFVGLDLTARKRMEFLRPRGEPLMRANPVDGGYAFEVLIPWDAMPPAPSLVLDRVFVHVEVHRGHGRVDREDMAPLLAEEESDRTWQELALEARPTYDLSPCRYPLRGRDRLGKWRPAFVFPAAPGETLDESFVICNDSGGYWHDPQGLSPVAHTTTFFAASPGRGEYVCGPALSILRDGVRLPVHDARTYLSDADMGLPVQPPMEARREGDSTVVKIGPRLTIKSPFGTGPCGACRKVELRLLTLSAAGRLEKRFTYDAVLQEPDLTDVDVHVSEDWRRIDIFELSDTDRDFRFEWFRTTHCLEDDVYRVCEPKRPSGEPAERVVDPTSPDPS